MKHIVCTAPRYDYEADWRPYVFPEPSARLSSAAEIRSLYTEVDLSADHLRAGGMPVWTDGRTACLNTRDEMTLSIGHTGAGKSRRGLAPTLGFLALAGENMVVMDVKGELTTGSLAPYVRGVLEQQDYQLVCYDLRTFGGDGFNPLYLPYEAYQRGDIGESIRLLHELFNSLADVYQGSSADPFWAIHAVLCLVSFSYVLFKIAPNPQMIHMLSLAMLLNDDGVAVMYKIKDRLSLPDIVLSALNEITSMPEKTRMSVIATAYSFLQSFVVNQRLMQMTCCSTFHFSAMARRKTAVFIVVPDEVDSYDRFAGILLSQLVTSLVQLAYQYGGSLPIRTNFLCDEFTQYHIEHMARNISAHRSRNIRWYIWCQGLEQLRAAYPKDAAVLLENCTNLYFMNSPDFGLLNYLSERSGKLVTDNGLTRPLLRVQDLHSLRKTDQYTETYISAPGVQFVTRMLDISQYPCFRFPYRKYTIPCHLPSRPVTSLTLTRLLCLVKGEHLTD